MGCTYGFVDSKLWLQAFLWRVIYDSVTLHAPHKPQVNVKTLMGITQHYLNCTLSKPHFIYTLSTHVPRPATATVAVTNALGSFPGAPQTDASLKSFRCQGRATRETLACLRLFPAICNHHGLLEQLCLH